MLVMVVIGYWVTTVLVCTFVAFIFFFKDFLSRLLPLVLVSNPAQMLEPCVLCS